ncbi:hypothetical protein D3C75_1147490 [compost metagenome]
MARKQPQMGRNTRSKPDSRPPTALPPFIRSWKSEKKSISFLWAWASSIITELVATSVTAAHPPRIACRTTSTA